MKQNKRLAKKIKVSTTLTLLTGLHVGGSKESVEIGGIDTPVIKITTKDNQPYIPGSSIKGKIRSLLEQVAGIAEVGGGTKKDGKDYKFVDKPKEVQKIINLFGFANDNRPSKLIVRDAYLSEFMNETDKSKGIKQVDKLKENEFLDMPYTEGKWENSINRIAGTAISPRQIERIPAGVKFDVNFIINVWEYDDGTTDGEDLFRLLEDGIELLENDYLGGSGSRGYGQVKFGELNKEEVSFEQYFEETKEN
jgi:CRISPR-associated protein Csm3